MLIKELSNRTGISIHTLRFYENYSLFRGVSDENIKTNNYKDYDESVVEKIKMIKGAKEVGFTLSEIKALLDSWYNEHFSIDKKVEVVNNKVSEIDSKILKLKQVKNLLLNAIKVIESEDC
ncbi:MerR family transcriptional regulator, Zn(II)-responsive regulator of zntA [Pedobacter westerhofensis]|uniref:MerR family transcriptional regulator, Zn(II)-responsive regulator of zntA n=1 Tax=Pedobacter westerhofensis TaxID=425512 RepID=A0A521FSF5_9SPHI|nr:MerR family transcriptional regulator [Pedobacter westerhofensis]SMO99153.1 MerR family transcriptional regulator, Zn(II)-responsive regulator of zntA [Pedobacter westerhofensis]